MQKIIELLKRAASITPNPQAPSPYADVLSRAVAWSIDLLLLYYLLQGVFDRLALKIFQHDDLATIDAVKRLNFGGMVRDGMDAWNNLQPSLLLDSPYFRLYMFEVLLEFFILGLVVVAVQMLWDNTPGKFLIGLKVVRRKSLEPVAKWRYPVRFLAYVPAVLPLMLGIVWAHFNRERRGWHDMIAGTVVIQTRNFDWYWSRLKVGLRKLTKKDSA